MSYAIYLSFNNQQEGFQIPINPGEILASDGNKGQTYDITKLGEINVIKSRKLTEFQFESFFPAPNKNYPFAATDLILPPERYKDMLDTWMDSKRPVRFIYIGSTIEINEAVSIEMFDWREVAGGMGDIEYSIAFKKYKMYSAQRVGVQVRTDSQVLSPVLEKQSPERPNDRIPPKEYTIRAGDTLWSIAKSQLGTGSLWTEIQSLNNITADEVKTLHPGRVLVLPNV